MCDPEIRIVASSARSASVLSVIHVSPPWCSQLIWPGAVNASPSGMRSLLKSCLPGAEGLSSASIGCRLIWSPSALRSTRPLSRGEVRNEVRGATNDSAVADVVDRAEDELVRPETAAEDVRVIPEFHGPDVAATIER